MDEWNDDQYLALVSSDASGACCLAQSTEGYVCTEDPHHDGWHRAATEDGEVFDVWPPKEY